MIFKCINTLMVFCSLCISSYAFSASPTSIKTIEVPSSETPGLNVGGSLSERIYNQSTDIHATDSSSSTMTMDSSLRLYFPTQFDLTNEHFKVSYSENESNLVGLMIGPQLPLASLSQIQINYFLHVGFAYSQGIYTAEADSGLAAKDEIELQWIPVQNGLEIHSRNFTNQNISFGLLSSVGMDWYTQTGRLDGMDQSFWMPRYELGSSVSLFKGSAQGFDGIRLSGIYYKSFASRQQNRGWAMDLGAKYAF